MVEKVMSRIKMISYDSSSANEEAGSGDLPPKQQHSTDQATSAAVKTEAELSGGIVTECCRFSCC